MNVSDFHARWLQGRTRTLAVIALVLAALVVGYLLRGPQQQPAPVPSDKAATAADSHDHDRDAKAKGAEAKKVEWWTCSMHPQIKLPHPGKCPICFMDLIPLESSSGGTADADLTHYTMSKAAKKLAEVETEVVKREPAKVIVRMVGMVSEDETRVAALTARVDGRLDEIYVNFTGVMVNVGDPMVKIWSPTLIKSQVELFETMKTDEEDPGVIRGAEEKLLQLGLTKEQIDRIRQQKKPDLYVTLRAPISGIVAKKNALLGQFVKEGQDMYIINDLSRVWIKLDAYETDMPWVRYGENVKFTTPSVPGQTFSGKVLFIDPMLTTTTRSVKIRVEANNPDLLLKPGMFVTAELEAEVDAKGRVIKSEWAGKFICPVHPSDTPSSDPGICPDSKMQLRPASAYGYADDKSPELPLLIPATAPLITGKRALVYVEIPNTDQPTYEGREVVLGPRAGDKYVVYSGLKEGERVVTKGNFKIDSAMQILAKPSMMSPMEDEKPKEVPEKPEEEVVEKIAAPKEFLEALTPAVKQYLELKDALVEDKVEDAGRHAGEMAETIKAIDASSLETKARKTWDELSGTMTGELKKIGEGKEIEAQRKAFDPLSEAFAKVIMGFRHVMKDPLVVFHCPMAFNSQGAYWIEGSEERRNPYFGHTKVKGQDMLQCGELIEKVPPETSAESGKPEAAKAEEPKPAASSEGSASKEGKDTATEAHSH